MKIRRIRRENIPHILRKLRLNKLLYSILRSFPQKKMNGNVAEARDYLNRISQRPLGTSFSEADINETGETIVHLQIIVAAYNVEAYIKACMDSILNQKTCYTFRLVVVNDGSSDSTPTILDDYRNDPRVTIIHQKNKGFSGARNTGLEQINAQFIMFVDSDDLLLEGAIQTLLDSAYRTGSDIAEGNYYSFNGETKKDNRGHDNSLHPKALGNLYGYPWGKVIRTKIFNQLKFPEGFWFEDSMFAYLVFPMCKSVSTVSDMVYGYRLNPAGISSKAKRHIKSIDTYWIMEQMLADGSKLNLTKSQEIYEHTLRQIQLNYNRTLLLEKRVKESIFVLTSDLMRNTFVGFKTNTPKYNHLEVALKTNNYGLYSLFCLLN